MAGKFEALHPVPVGCREDHSFSFQPFDISRVHFIPVAVALDDLFLEIEPVCQGALADFNGIVPETHRAAELVESLLFRKKSDHVRPFTELLARSIRNARLVPGILHGCQLEPEAEAEEGDIILAGELNRLDLS